MSSAGGLFSARANESKKYTGSTIRAARPKGVRQLADLFNRLEAQANRMERTSHNYQYSLHGTDRPSSLHGGSRPNSTFGRSRASSVHGLNGPACAYGMDGRNSTDWEGSQFSVSEVNDQYYHQGTDRPSSVHGGSRPNSTFGRSRASSIHVLNDPSSAYGVECRNSVNWEDLQLPDKAMDEQYYSRETDRRSSLHGSSRPISTFGMSRASSIHVVNGPASVSGVDDWNFVNLERCQFSGNEIHDQYSQHETDRPTSRIGSSRPNSALGVRSEGFHGLNDPASLYGMEGSQFPVNEVDKEYYRHGTDRPTSVHGNSRPNSSFGTSRASSVQGLNGPASLYGMDGRDSVNCEGRQFSVTEVDNQYSRHGIDRPTSVHGSSRPNSTRGESREGSVHGLNPASVHGMDGQYSDNWDDRQFSDNEMLDQYSHHITDRLTSLHGMSRPTSVHEMDNGRFSYIPSKETHMGNGDMPMRMQREDPWSRQRSRRDSCSSRMSSIGVPEGEPLPDEEEQQNDQELCRQSEDSHVIRRQIDEMFDFGKEDAAFVERERELPVNEPPRGLSRRDSNSTCTGRYAAYSERGGPSHGSNRVGGISQFRYHSNFAPSSVCIRAESPQPQFSPAAVHAITESAGQRVAAYEAKEGQRPVRVHSGRCVPPSARATSTPLQSSHSSVADRGSILIHGGQAVRRSHVPLDVVQNLSFISSISTGSAEGEATVIRRGGLTPGKNDVPPCARDFPRPSALDYKMQIARMKDMQGKEEEKIKITTKALTFARKKQKRMNEMSAQRTLLLARLRVSSLKKEQQRLSALSIVRHPPPPISRDVLGAMDVSDITIHLNRGLTALVNESDVSYSFVVVLKCGVEVDGTAPVTILVGPRPSVRLVHFPEHLRFSNLPVDFVIGLEVYVMKQRELKDENCAAALASKARSFLLPAGGIRNNAVTSGDLPISEFVRCGLTALNRDTTGVMRFYLDGAEYPLEGTIELAARCTRLPSAVEIDFRGFLTMYKVVGGLGSWVRFWAVLRRAVIYFWKYPDDEMIDRAAVASADLSKCMNSAISPCSRDVCSRPHTFSLDMLVSAAPSIIERKRVLLAADSKDQLNAWVAALNETLAALRG